MEDKVYALRTPFRIQDLVSPADRSVGCRLFVVKYFFGNLTNGSCLFYSYNSVQRSVTLLQFWTTLKAPS